MCNIDFFCYTFLCGNFYPLRYLHGVAQYALLLEHSVLSEKYLRNAFRTYFLDETGCSVNNVTLYKYDVPIVKYDRCRQTCFDL